MLMKLRAVGLLLLLVLLASGLGYSGQAAEKTVIYAQHMALTDLDPAYGAFLLSPSAYEVAFCLYDRLIGLDEHMNIVPELAERWEVSEDGRIWTLHLRKGVKFHDGTPCDAKAIEFNVIRLMDPTRTTTNRPQWDPWEKVEVINDYTVKLATKEPFGWALRALAHGGSAIVSPAAVEKWGDEEVAHHPVGTGPFRMQEFDVGREAVLVANKEYWKGVPKVDKLIFKYVPEASVRIAALLAGEVDVIDDVPSHEALRLERDPNIQVFHVPGLRPYQLNFFLWREPFKDKRVRQAFNYAVSKEAIAKGLFLDFAKPADSPLAFDTFGHATIGVYEYNPEKAKELLAEAGWIDSDGDGILDKNGKPLEVTILTPHGWRAQDIQVVEAVAKQLSDVGIKVTIDKVERGAFFGYITCPPSEVKWDLAFFGFTPSNASGTYHLENLYLSNPDPTTSPWAWNMLQYSNEEVDSLIMEAKRTMDPDKRGELLAEAQRIIWDDAPAIWLVVPEIISAARTDIKGVEVWPVAFTILYNASVGK